MGAYQYAVYMSDCNRGTVATKKPKKQNQKMVTHPIFDEKARYSNVTNSAGDSADEASNMHAEIGITINTYNQTPTFFMRTPISANAAGTPKSNRKKIHRASCNHHLGVRQGVEGDQRQ